MIDHFIHRIFKNLIRRFHDKDENNQARDRIHDRKSHSCAHDSDQRTDRGKRIGTVMPCICHQCAGINLFRIISGVPVHRFFTDNGYNSRCQRQHSRNLQVTVFSLEHVRKRLHANPQTCHKENHREDNRSHTLHPLMSIRVLLVRLFGRQLNSNHHDHRAEHIGRRMDTVTDHRIRMCEHTR